MSERQYKVSDAPSISSHLIDQERIRLVDDFPVLRNSYCWLVMGRASNLWNLLQLSQRFFSGDLAGPGVIPIK